MSKHLTPKEKVKKKYPNAGLVVIEHNFTFPYAVRSNGTFGSELGLGYNPRAAWADAARKI